MEFSGEFELEGVSPADAWVMLSDPITVRNAPKGCQCVTRIDEGGVGFEEHGTESGPKIAWGTETDISGRIARQMTDAEGGVTQRLRNIP